MVKPLAIILLYLTAYAGATESSVLAYRAQKSINAGNFAKGYSQLERALIASRKESDLLSEGRILINMAQIRCMSLDLNLADSLVSIVREQALDENTSTNLATVKASISNARENYTAGLNACNSISKKTITEADDPIQAAFYAECAISFAGAKNKAEAENALKKVEKLTDKNSGFYAFTKARVASINEDNNADTLYEIAEKKSIQGNKPYITATILYKRSQLKNADTSKSKDFKLRCKNAFELMGLPNNAKKCAE